MAKKRDTSKKVEKKVGIMTGDSPEQIAMCMSCPYDECVDCIRNNPIYRWKAKKRLNVAACGS